MIRKVRKKSPNHTSQWKRGGKEGRIRSGWEIKECEEMSFKNKNERRNKAAMPKHRRK